MKRKRTTLLRHDDGKSHTERYRWVTDRADGFAQCEILYDSEGQLLGVDYRSDRKLHSDPRLNP